MSRKRYYLVHEVARLSGVSVRTLHHYDEVGLLVPRGRSAAGYRLYDDADLERLQQILVGRELGLSLEAIRRSLDDPAFDRRGALRAQRVELEKRVDRAQEMIRSIDRALALLDDPNKGDDMNPSELFDGFQPAEYEEEARARWGETEAYRISAERTKGYGPEEWQAIREEQGALYSGLAEAQARGAAPSDPEVMELAERHRLSIDRWFYPCSYDMHRGLADLYENDPRFAANIDRMGAGLTPFLSAAIRENAKRRGR